MLLRERQAASVPHQATRFAFGGGARTTDRRVAVETAVNVVYNTVPYAVMMATPGDLEDFALGFSLTEGIIAAAADLRSVVVEAEPAGLRLLIDLARPRLHALLARRRAMAGRTSCGVCGIEDLAALPRCAEPAIPRAGPILRVEAIERALAGLAGQQALHAATGAVHAAAWAGLDGGLACVREDVGRHNALDKLIGALLARGTEPAEGFVVLTSRCSYEMVEKAAAFGAGALVAISAPTSLGVARAEAHGMTLIGLARDESCIAYAGAGRVLSRPG